MSVFADNVEAMNGLQRVVRPVVQLLLAYLIVAVFIILMVLAVFAVNSITHPPVTSIQLPTLSETTP